MKLIKHSSQCALIAALTLSACGDKAASFPEENAVITDVCYYQTQAIKKNGVTLGHAYSLMESLIIDYGMDFIARGDIGNAVLTGKTADKISFVVTKPCSESYEIASMYRDALQAGLKRKTSLISGLTDPVSVTQDVYERG